MHYIPVAHDETSTFDVRWQIQQLWVFTESQVSSAVTKNQGVTVM